MLVYHHVEPEEQPRRKKKGGFRRILATLLISLIAGGIGGYGGASLYQRQNASHDAEHSSKTTLAEKQVIRTDQDGNMDIPSIAATAMPAVVGIATYAYQNQGALLTPFGYIMPDEKDSTLTPYAWGSGVIIEEEGTILTNNHVIEGAEKIVVSTYAGDEYEATLVGADKTTDLAVLKIKEKGNFNALPIGDSDELVVGETVVAVGNPLAEEFSQSVTDGIVSGINRALKMDNHITDLIQTNCAINSGNSGGALVNAHGELVGINSSKISATGVEGIGFAIPINDAMNIFKQLKASGSVERPQIGISGYNLTKPMAERLGITSVSAGVLVAEIQAESAAAKADIQPGDVIIKAEDKPVADFAELSNAMADKKAGDHLKVTLVREGTEKELDLTLQ